MNSFKGHCSQCVLVAQWIERPPCVQEVMGLIPVGDSDISLSHACVVLIHSSFTFHYRAQTLPSSLITYHNVFYLQNLRNICHKIHMYTQSVIMCPIKFLPMPWQGLFGGLLKIGAMFSKKNQYDV